MKKMNRNSLNISGFSRIFAAFLLVIAATSCSHDSLPSDPMDLIPADAKQISAMDLDALAKGSGGSLMTADGVLSPEGAYAIDMFFPSQTAAPLTAVLNSYPEGVDHKHVVTFTTAAGNTLTLLKVTGELPDAPAPLNSFRTADKDTDGFSIYTIGEATVAVGDKLIVITDDIATIGTLADNVSSSPISPIVGVKQFLTKDAAVNTARPGADIYGDKMAGLWFCATMRISDSAITADFTAIDPSGKVDNLGERIAAEIDPTVQGYIPPGCTIVAAMGQQSDEAKMFGIEDLVKPIFPGMTVVSQTGTTLWYARPAGALNLERLLDINSWNIGGAVAMPQDEGNTLAAEFARDRKWSNPSIADPVNVKYYEGYLLESLNGEVTGGNSNPYAELFDSARLVVIADIPAESSLQRTLGVDCGASVTLKLNTTTLRARVTFYGNTEAPLPTFATFPYCDNVIPYLLGTEK